MKVVALTGGIGSGKSAVAEMLRELGAATIDTDQLAREAVAPGTKGLAAVVAHFGADILAVDGSIDRAKLRRQVFRDPPARLALEAILHPLIFLGVGEWIARRQTEKFALLVVEIPLLFEVETPPIFAATICVDVSREVQIARVKARSDLDERQVAEILAAQMSSAEKAARADFVIDNNGDLANTRRHVADIYRRLTS